MPQSPTVALPKRLPLVTLPENRGTDPAQDAKLVNCYVEKMENGEYWIYKRAGLLEAAQPAGTAAAGLGLFNWLGDIYSVFGGTLYKNGIAITGSVDSTASYRFSSSLGSTPKLQLGNGVFAYNYDATNGLVLINDGDFPASFVKGWCYLDGTTYVATPSATIQGSDINDPVNWNPLNVITAQIEPDKGIGLAKQLVYAIIFKQWSTEVFYDAGNATGSPLGTVQGGKANFGCVSADSVQSIDGILIWVCTNQSASTQIIMMEGLKVQIISTDPVERLLDNSNFSVTYSLQLKNIGHRFYIITAKNSNITLAYDLDQKMWSQWTDVDGNYFPFVASTYNSTTLRHIFQHESDGWLYLVNESYYTDNGDPITADVVTPNFDGGIYRRKQMTMMKFVVDQTPGSVLQVRKNDNDYALDQWSNFRIVDLGQRQPVLTNCGTFVRRAYQLRHQSATPFRIKAVELQLDVGTL